MKPSSFSILFFSSFVFRWNISQGKIAMFSPFLILTSPRYSRFFVAKMFSSITSWTKKYSNNNYDLSYAKDAGINDFWVIFYYSLSHLGQTLAPYLKVVRNLAFLRLMSWYLCPHRAVLRRSNCQACIRCWSSHELAHSSLERKRKIKWFFVISYLRWWINMKNPLFA